MQIGKHFVTFSCIETIHDLEELLLVVDPALGHLHTHEKLGRLKRRVFPLETRRDAPQFEYTYIYACLTRNGIVLLEVHRVS